MRQRKDKKENATEKVMARVTRKEKELIEKAAAQAKNRSEFMRKAIMKSVREALGEEASA